jgi:hypothetical protein
MLHLFWKKHLAKQRAAANQLLAADIRINLWCSPEHCNSQFADFTGIFLMKSNVAAVEFVACGAVSE